MTFETNQKNTFKKNPLRGLEYKQKEAKHVPIVQIVLVMATCLLIATVFKMCTDKPERIPLSVLNATRR